MQPSVSLDQIKALGVVGNAYSDSQVLTLLDQLIQDRTATMQDRLAAIDYLSNEVMGLDEPAATEKDLEEYLETC